MAAKSFGGGSVGIFNLGIKLEQFASGPNWNRPIRNNVSMTAGKLPTHIGNSSWGFPHANLTWLPRISGAREGGWTWAKHR